VERRSPKALGLASALSLTGCSLVLDFDSEDAAPDAAIAIDAALVDADPGFGPWQNIRPVTELNGLAADLKISLTGDGLEATFDSDRDGPRNIYSATRAALTEPWSNPVVVAELSTLVFDGHSALSDDGLTIFFARNQGMAVGVEILEAARPVRGDLWGPAAVVASLSSAATDDGPDISADGQTLVFSSSRAGDRDLFIASRMGADWLVSELAELNTGDDELDPDISPDLLELYFARRIADVSTVMVATRPDVASPFGNVTAVPELGDATGPRVSGDRRTIHFHRTEATTGVDLFVADR